MGEDTATAKPVAAISQTAALLSFAAAATFLVLLAALHFIKPELDPSQAISAYLPTRLWGEVTWAAVEGRTASLGNWLGLLAYAAGFAALAIWGYRRGEGTSYR